MTRIFRKTVCLILCLMVAFSSVASSVAAAASSYPDGVTASQATDAVSGTDKLVDNAVPALTGQDLQSLVTSGLYTDETVSGLLVSIYTSLSEGDFDLSYIGIDTSVKTVASTLTAYPQVSGTLATYDSWSDVDITALKWGVTGRDSFASAVGACFSLFEPVFFTLLCSGDMEIGSFIKIQGADGYGNAIVPILTALGCKDMMSQARFTYYAQKDRSTMVKNIISPVLAMLEESLLAPADSFTEILPTFAEFTVSGKLNEYIGVLLSPITSNSLVNAMISLGIFGVDMDAEQMINGMLTGTSDEGSLKMAPIDLDALAACGTGSGDTFVPDKSMAYVEIMRWLVETLKLNANDLSALLGASSEDTSFSDMINGEETDNIVATIILLFSPEEIIGSEAMKYPEITPFNVTYTPNLKEADYIRALEEVDPLLDAFVKEGGSAQTIGAVLSSAIYNNNNITSLVKGVYGALEENGLSSMLALMGMDISPKGVASYLTSDSHKSAAATLSSIDSWSQLSADGISWGVATGSRRNFQSALTAVLRPLAPALRMMLAGQDLVIFDSAVIKGADGYNTAVIPILEALGCRDSDIKGYSAYKNASYGDGVITQILEPVFNLLDDVCEKPVYTLTGILPNIIYFLDSGSLEVCMNNLMRPLTSLTKNLSSVSASLDMSALTETLDIESLLGGMLSGMGMTFAELDIKSFGNMGTPSSRTSKSAFDGKNATYTYIEADKAGVFLTLLRFVAETMRIPGNEDLLMSTMSSDNMGSYASYTDSLTEQISVMNTDELVEWLFNLFFKERIKVSTEVKEEYVPDITYQAPEKSYTGLIVLFVVIGVVVIGVAVAVFGGFTKKQKHR